MKGRPPKPSEQKKREGNPGKRSTDVVLVAGREKPRVPAGLNPAAKNVWRIIVADMWDSRILDRADRFIIEATSVAIARARQARKLVNKEGLTVRGATGAIIQHPAIKIERESWNQFRQLAEHLGLSPVARARLGLAHVKGARDRKSTRLNSSHTDISRMPSSA